MRQSETQPLTIPAAAAKAEIAEPVAVQESFFQRPFAQKLLPLLTSLSVHAGVVVVGLLTYSAITIIHERHLENQVTPSDGGITQDTSVLRFPGSTTDPFSRTLQNQIPNQKDGVSDVMHNSASMFNKAAGGAPASDVSLISVGAGDAFGKGGVGLVGGPGGPGTGDGGPIAAFGPAPTIGGSGPVFVKNGDARRIVYLCDATGSMLNKFPTLKDELNKAVVELRPIQSFDIIFFQGQKMEQMSPGLIPATPENKRKAGNYLNGVTATDVTDPIPSLTAALKLKPQVIHFLTDAADFPDQQAVLNTINQYNADRKIRIHTILFVENRAERERNADSEGLMKRIATENGGTFRWVELDAIQ